MAKGYVSINVERCKGCAFCFNSKGYHPPHVVAPDKCSGCDLCGMYCPDFAIYGWKTAEPKREIPNAG
jgi:2-oxoglutarate ferredoxin oxidoreductase subunit delta